MCCDDDRSTQIITAECLVYLSGCFEKVENLLSNFVSFTQGYLSITIVRIYKPSYIT